MTEQTIKIDVPEEYDIYYEPSYGKEGLPSLSIKFKKKVPEFIEVRDCLALDPDNAKYVSVV